MFLIYAKLSLEIKQKRKTIIIVKLSVNKNFQQTEVGFCGISDLTKKNSEPRNEPLWMRKNPKKYPENFHNWIYRRRLLYRKGKGYLGVKKVKKVAKLILTWCFLSPPISDLTFPIADVAMAARLIALL